MTQCKMGIMNHGNRSYTLTCLRHGACRRSALPTPSAPVDRQRQVFKAGRPVWPSRTIPGQIKWLFVTVLKGIPGAGGGAAPNTRAAAHAPLASAMRRARQHEEMAHPIGFKGRCGGRV